MGIHLNEKKLKELIAGKLSRHFGKEINEASYEELYSACSFIVRDILMENWARAQDEIEKKEGGRRKKQKVEKGRGKKKSKSKRKKKNN